MTEEKNNFTETKVLLARIDERTKNLEKELKEISEKLDKDYVSRDEFAPIKKIVYGMVGVILLAAAVAMVNLVITT